MLTNYKKRKITSSHCNKRGFAVSGILYPLLILTLFLVVQILFMMQTRKNVLDKVKTELSETVNEANKIYNNEELSTLIQEQAKTINDQKSVIDNLSKKLNDVGDTSDKSKNTLTYNTDKLSVKKVTYGKYIENSDKYAVLKIGNINIGSFSMMLLTLKTYTYSYYNTINLGAYMYGPDGIYSPSASYLNKKNIVPVSFGVRKSDGSVFVIVDKSLGGFYFSLYVDEVSLSYSLNPESIESGWDMYSTNDLSAFTVYNCTVL